MIRKILPIMLLAGIISACNQTKPPQALEPTPTENQILWNEMERNAFIHFGLNTFNDMEWGYGDSPASTFNPSELDAEQWCRIIKEAGMKGVVLTCKHHDGFCLWPFEGTEYSVKNSPWREGKGDLVREVSDACRKYGLKFGIYLSPWDRNTPLYGSPEYIDYFRAQLTDLLTNYGEVFEIWLDGANGGTGYYGGANDVRSVDRKTYYDWPGTIEIMRKLQPNALIFSDAGPDIRWCGNESGVGGRTNWSPLRRDEAWPGWPRYHELNPGHEDGDYWVPAEINTSIRPGWFYHKSEDHQVKTLPQMMDYYYESVGRNGTALLNFPIDHRGLIHEIDAERVIEWEKTIQKELAENLSYKVGKIHATNERGRAYSADKTLDSDKNTYWATEDSTRTASLTFEFDEEISFNRFVAQEYIKLGQRVQAFSLEAMINNEWKEIAKETTIGFKRILRLPDTKTNKIRFTILKAKACPTITNIEFYNAPQLLSNPEIRRNRDGQITIINPNKSVEVYYTLDGSAPTHTSLRYSELFDTKGKVIVKAITYDKNSTLSSPVSTESFDIDHSEWLVLKTEDENSGRLLDGNPHTHWTQGSDKMPIDLVIDLGKKENIAGFKYLPDQSRWSRGIITEYEFYVSNNMKKWNLYSEGEFSNIKNSPTWREIKIKPVNARYVKLRAVSNTAGDHYAGYAEFDVITE